MHDIFDEKLKRLARESNIKEPESIRINIKLICKNLNRTRFINKKYATVAAALILLVTIMGTYIPISANENPFIKNVISYFTEKYDAVNKGHEENSQNENIIVQSNGYTISIEDIYYDRVEMTIFYKIKSEKPLNRHSKYLLELESEFGDKVDTEVRWENQEGEFIDEYTYGGMYQCYIAEINGDELPKTLSGRLKINGLMLDLKDTTEQISLQLNSIPLNLDSTRMKSKEIDINKQVYGDSNYIDYIKAVITPTGMDLNYKIENEESNIFTGLWDSKKGYLKGEINKGKYPSEKVTSYRYELPSDDGEVSIIPYRYSNSEIRNRNNNFKSMYIKEQVTLDLGSQGTLEIENIEFKENETIMTIKTTGYISFDPFRVGIYDSEYNRYYPIAVKNREVYGLMEMKADYIFNHMDNVKDYSFIYWEHEILELLKDQIIQIK
ncbi:MAG: DUF4179 domain-containing protein [Aeromonas sp.]